jgi:hypothetical protein
MSTGNIKKIFLGSKVLGLATLPPSMSRLSRQCGILNISQPYRPPRTVTGIALLLITLELFTTTLTGTTSSKGWTNFQALCLVTSTWLTLQSGSWPSNSKSKPQYDLVSQSVCRGVDSTLGLVTRRDFLFEGFVRKLLSCLCAAPSLTGLSFVPSNS